MNRSIGKYLVRSLLLGALIVAIGSCSIQVTVPSDLRVTNSSSTYTLAHVYITQHSSSVWGPDQLSPNVLLPGESAKWSVDPGSYDVWVTDTTPYDAYAFGITVSSSSTTTLYFDGVNLAP